MSTERKLICIVCPIGCIGEVSIIDGQVSKLQGFICERGKSYAYAEAINPLRMLTTTVRVKGGALPLLPVVSSAALPKHYVALGVQLLGDIIVDAPIKAGQVVYRDLFGLGIDIIASRDLVVRPM